MSKKRLRTIKNRKVETQKQTISPIENIENNTEIVRIKRDNKFLEFYDVNYKKLLIIPFLILFLALGQIFIQYQTTGDFMHKGVSLSGGVTLTIPGYEDVIGLETKLNQIYPKFDINARAVGSIGNVQGVLIEAIAETKEDAENIQKTISKITGVSSNEISIDLVGSSLGDSFFKQTFYAIILAFLFMGIVVFLYFRAPAPSLAVMLAAFSDIVVTLAVVNLLGIKISTAGIAAFLMLIGYSIDTDILLSTRVLKQKTGDVFSRVMNAMETGLTMNFTTLAALTVGMILSNSEVLTQIMTILFIGLIVDIINTWIQNVGILRLYLERKEQ